MSVRKISVVVCFVILGMVVSPAYAFKDTFSTDTPEHHMWRIISVSSIALIYSTNLFRADSAGFDYGNGENVEFTRGHFRWNYRKNALDWKHAKVDIMWQATIAKWQSTIDESQEEANNVLSVGPVFRLHFKSQWLPFFETSIAPAIFSNNKVNDKQFGSNVQFEDTLTIGWQLGKKKKWEIAGRFMHFSSNSLDTPNEGINFYMGGVTYRYD